MPAANAAKFSGEAPPNIPPRKASLDIMEENMLAAAGGISSGEDGRPRPPDIMEDMEDIAPLKSGNMFSGAQLQQVGSLQPPPLLAPAEERLAEALFPTASSSLES